MRSFLLFLLEFIATVHLLLLRPVGAQQIKLDGLSGLTDLLEGLAGAAKQKPDGTCPSHCEELHPNNHHLVSPAPKERIRPYSNGCSVPDSLRDGLGDYSHFTECCDLHDTCYMSCGVPKPYCEKEFGKCMEQSCKTKFHGRGKDYTDCLNKAQMFKAGTSMFGCGGYTDLQRDGCDCLTHDEAEKRVTDYAHQFYSVYNATHPLPDKVVSMFLNHGPSDTPRKRHEKHGMMLYRLYKRYPHAIDVIDRDGKAGRSGVVQFDLPAKDPEL